MCYVFQVKIPHFQSRYGHSSTVFSLVPELAEIVLFGGVFKFPENCDFDHEDPFLGITVLQFGESIEFTTSHMTTTCIIMHVT